MDKKVLEKLLELGRQTQEKMNLCLLYEDTMQSYLQQHNKIDPEIDNVVMLMMLDAHRHATIGVITLLEATENQINEYVTDIDEKIDQLGFIHPYLEKFKKDYELNMKVLSQIIDKSE